ncbi:hypothetical protein WRSd3_01976 [Shigella dysenteriae WRSd3]|uniref:Uncharacterized protein n=1 Tax=Shigella dysenteriae WRSd3 TaxID=1401327 RepID=A0A090NXK2_SHIDY|nr:hypothetical protein WRSd3_01976 [Shigella dysenteriae WRSd3]ESU81809.1 hypothetical protein WRSd5_02899 [Shigella dysenteriae WRSd5]
MPVIIFTDLVELPKIELLKVHCLLIHYLSDLLF